MLVNVGTVLWFLFLPTILDEVQVLLGLGWLAEVRWLGHPLVVLLSCQFEKFLWLSSSITPITLAYCQPTSLHIESSSNINK